MTTATTYDQRLAEETDKYEAMFATGPGKTFTGDDAVRWCETVLGRTYWSFQKNFIRAVFDNPRVVARSCNGIGKTLICADIALCFLFNRGPAKVPTLAPTFPQVRNSLWAEINTGFNRIKEMETEGGPEVLPGIECLQTRLELAPGWFAVGLSPEKGINLQGLHQRNIMAILDESPGIRPDVTETIQKLLTGRNSYLVEIGNPLESSGAFYDHCRMGKAYEPGMKDYPGWVTFHISYEDTPNFTHLQDDPDPDDVNLPQSIKDQLISEKWVEERRDEWGEDSPLFQSGCKGDFPVDDGKSVISLKLCMDAVNRETEPTGAMVLGVDVGAGGDLSAYARRQGQVIMDVKTESTPESEDVIRTILEMHNRDQYELITVDSCGIGWGIVGRLRGLGIPVRGLNVAEAANDPETYLKRRDELWYGGKDWLKHGKIPDDKELIADLTGPQKATLGNLGQLRVESKKDTKKRLKTRSPDRADAVLLAIQGTQGDGWIY